MAVTMAMTWEAQMAEMMVIAMVAKMEYMKVAMSVEMRVAMWVLT
jgi:hypothetical protein